MFQPTTFGDYFLTRRLAVGGMAEVYAAKLYGADGFEKDIVIKQILPQYARDPEFVQSFVAEAKIAVALNHANIAGIYELGRIDGTYFIAMELVDGLDVFTLIDGARRAGITIDHGLALLVAEETLKGLDYAHRKLGPDGRSLGLVHRDLSPRNVLISREGDVKILDFGIAKTRSEAAAMPKTRAGVVKGTTGYMSPEQATGGEVDARTDVYQTGLLLFELLTGEALFWRPDDEETRELMRRHRVLRPSELNPAVSEELDRIVLAALARDPAKRVQSAEELGNAVARLRVLRYPDATLRELGMLVARVAALQEAEVEAQAELMPSTRDLGDAARIETFASAPIVTERREPATPAAASIPAVAAASTSPPLPPPVPPASAQLAKPPQPAGSRSVVAAAAVIATAAVIVWGVGALAERNEKIEPGPSIIAPIELTATPTTSAVEALETKTLPRPQAELVKPAQQITAVVRPKKEVPDALPSTVSFGTRSCSSRVTIDGVIVARSTPSYDHKIAPGTHTVSVEGTSCPLIERPGSLKPSLPSVVKKIEVAPGVRLKMIADFAREELLVREE